MSVFFTHIVEILVLPPGGPMLLILIGGLMLAARRRGGGWVFSAGFLALYLFATPLVNGWLAAALERYPALTKEALRASGVQAIVVLGGGRYHDAPEYGGSTSSAAEVERLRYAAHLQRASGLPIMVDGGDPFDTGESGATFMRRVLEGEFQVPVQWSDGRSRHTFDNARYARDVLRPALIDRIALVTHAWHMPRSVWAFEQEGFEVVAAPTGFSTPGETERGVLSLLPQAQALRRSVLYLHELLGMVWYWVFGR